MCAAPASETIELTLEVKSGADTSAELLKTCAKENGGYKERRFDIDAVKDDARAEICNLNNRSLFPLKNMRNKFQRTTHRSLLHWKEADDTDLIFVFIGGLALN